ncbi:MAG: hypothetical protein HOI59_13700 [Nitrospina sp.]|jgi:hypothetical protein|nr:hypothetical protein [Nitrospina sp.]MBT3414297.1 hypothetical protein [Nitrospina sp.]MBT3855484.1 hypothetical protein [Nitrospina sp.]MBT4103687.1 hypothetical protein [Nitrospina sp.]MBT4388400.1 hypothetical protein [Nitrospina sp.]
MPKKKWVQNVIWGVIFLNLVVIVRVFIIPRTHFITSHFQERREALRESSGPLDMPNQYAHTYRMMKQVREMASEESLLLLPPDDWEFGSPRSAVIQTLYPRKVYFSGDEGFDKKLSQAFHLKEAYVMFNDRWGKGLCKNRTVKHLGEQGFGICRIDKN